MFGTEGARRTTVQTESRRFEQEPPSARRGKSPTTGKSLRSYERSISAKRFLARLSSRCA